MTATVHRIHTADADEEDRSYWECSCGAAGSANTWRVDAASDRHIPEGEQRVDTSRPLS